ncbi:MAG: hypothetical protein ACO3CV_08720 [Steroidobacteraceae bacterium]
MKRIALLGGSGASTPELADALARRYPRDGSEIEIVLQGRNHEKLAAVQVGFSARLGGHPAVRVSAESSLDRAVDGATIVINQVRIGGLDARAFDERFPHAFGIFGEETMGPGGFSNAVRTVPALSSTWRSVLAHAPDALVINLTNPSGVVVAVAHSVHPKLNIVSVCDVPATFLRAINAAAGTTHPANFASAEPRRYIGLNHAGVWVPPHTVGAAPFATAHREIDADVVEGLGAIPVPYLRFYLHPKRQYDAQREAKETRAEALMRLEPTLLAEAREGRVDAGVTRRGAVWYEEIIAPLVAAHLRADVGAGIGQSPLILGLPNHGAAPWLPTGVVVEGVAALSDGSWGQRELFEPPSGARDLLARVAAYESALVAALQPAGTTGDLGDSSRAALVEALALNPAVNDHDLATQLYGAIEASPHV